VSDLTPTVWLIAGFGNTIITLLTVYMYLDIACMRRERGASFSLWWWLGPAIAVGATISCFIEAYSMSIKELL